MEILIIGCLLLIVLGLFLVSHRLDQMLTELKHANKWEGE